MQHRTLFLIAVASCCISCALGCNGFRLVSAQAESEKRMTTLHCDRRLRDQYCTEYTLEDPSKEDIAVLRAHCYKSSDASFGEATGCSKAEQHGLCRRTFDNPLTPALKVSSKIYYSEKDSKQKRLGCESSGGKYTSGQ